MFQLNCSVSSSTAIIFNCNASLCCVKHLNSEMKDFEYAIRWNRISSFSCTKGLLPDTKQLFLSQFVSFESPETRKSDVLVMYCLHFEVISH